MERNAEPVLRIAAEILLNQGRREAVKTSGHRRVRREQIARPCGGKCNIEGLPGLPHERPGAFQHGEGRMPFIQVAHFRMEAQCLEQPPAADAEDQFLLNAQLRTAAVQFAGDAAMGGEVRRVIAVQQIELHSADLNLPGAQPDRITTRRHLQPQPLPLTLPSPLGRG